MQSRKINLDHERKILIGIITSTDFLNQVAPSLKLSYFKSSYSKVVAGWVLEYHKNFSQAPGKLIQDIYFDRREQIADKDDNELISILLTNLSSDYVNQNIDYSVRQAIEYLKRRSFEVLVEHVQEQLDTGDLVEADRIVSSYSQVDVSKQQGVNVLDDCVEIHKAFNDESERLYRLPGALGDATGWVYRGDFKAYLAFAKRGKSYALETDEEAALQAGLNVVHFSFEMNKAQNIRRHWEAYSGLPWKSGNVRIPYFEETYEGDGRSWKIDYYDEYRKGFPIELSDVEAIQSEVRRNIRDGNLKLFTLPSRSSTVRDIKSRLISLENYENFIPDVVIIDYADLLKAYLNGEFRHKIDEIWAELRGLAEEMSIAIITASQSNRASVNADVNEETIAEDIRKAAHVTMLVGINQTKREKAEQIYRFQVVNVREHRGTISFDEVIALSCLDIGRMVLDSKFLKDVVYEKERQAKRKNLTYS